MFQNKTTIVAVTFSLALFLGSVVKAAPTLSPMQVCVDAGMKAAGLGNMIRSHSRTDLRSFTGKMHNKISIACNEKIASLEKKKRIEEFNKQWFSAEPQPVPVNYVEQQSNSSFGAVRDI